MHTTGRKLIAMRLPAYGQSLWNRRLLGERLRVVTLLVGNRWKCPGQFHGPPGDPIPRVAVKTASWHERGAERFDWRLVAACTVLAVDVRGPDEREQGPEGWDPWLWLLADVLTFARDVLRFTITEDLKDSPAMFAPERDVETYAWLCRTCVDGVVSWPVWWPHGDRGDLLQEAAA